MKSVLKEIERRIGDALQRAGLDGSPLVSASQDARFGDYQSNCAMGMAKKLGKKPREVAETVIENLDLAGFCDPPEIAGPGFINLRILPSFLAQSLGSVPPAGESEMDRVGLPPVDRPLVISVDFSSPNLAKEMHIGHLRSTVIGDCVCRLLEFAGHTVHRENHVGDWGTQFGMLVAHLRRVRPDVADSPEDLVISDLETFYVEAKTHFDADEAFRTESRETVVALQKGDPAIRRIWKAFCDESLRHCHAIYDRLGVDLIDRGESFYNDTMDVVVSRLEEMASADPGGFVRVSDGALCIFLEDFFTRDGDPLPLIARKSDGGYNYATSDLATLIHRMEHLKTDKVVYVVGPEQKQHLAMVFAASKKVGWVAQDVSLIHLWFGSMLSATGRPFRTREGGTVKLKDVLDESVSRARAVVEAQNTRAGEDEPVFAPDEVEQIAQTVGLGAVRYFDLSHSLRSDYKFDYNIMLALEGNTAPYLIYAYARIRSIGRKAGIDWSALPTDAPLLLEHPAEIALAKKLLQFADALALTTRDLRPNVLTDYLFELAKAFSRFYDKKQGVRVVGVEPAEVRNSRLRLCDLTARTLKLGLHLLGIETLEKM